MRETLLHERQICSGRQWRYRLWEVITLSCTGQVGLVWYFKGRDGVALVKWPWLNFIKTGRWGEAGSASTWKAESKAGQAATENSEPFFVFASWGSTISNKLIYIQQERFRLDTVLFKTNKNPKERLPGLGRLLSAGTICGLTTWSHSRASFIFK